MSIVVFDPTEIKTKIPGWLTKTYAGLAHVPKHLVTKQYLDASGLKPLGPVVADVLKIDEFRPPHKQRLPTMPVQDIQAARSRLEEFGFTQDIIPALERLESLGYARFVHLYDINQTRPVRSRAAATASQKRAFSWLKDRISYLCYGKKDQDGTPKPVRTKATLIRNYNNERLPLLTADMLKRHCNNRETLYFWADHRLTTEEIIFLIDIDALKAKKQGSKQGAVKLAEYLIEHYFPNAYMELSTHGNGVHLFLVLRKKGIPNEDVRKALKHLDAWLKYIVRKIDADIEEVEVKGLPPIVQYKEDKLVGMTYGLLAKLPREAVSRLPELQNTYRCTPSQLLALEIPKKEKKVTSSKGGSVSGRLISEEEIATLEQYKQVGMTLLRNVLPRTSEKSRHRITWDDVAIMLLILKFCYEHPEPDNALPMDRIRQLWKALYAAGDVSRAWHNDKGKPLRDAISDTGGIDWFSNKYGYGYRTGGYRDEEGNWKEGKWHQGVCCRWSITPELYGILVGADQEASSIPTGIVTKDEMERIRPIKDMNLVKAPWIGLTEWLYSAQLEAERICGYA